MTKILMAIDYCFYIYMTMILVRCLLTWLPGVNWENPILNALRSSVDLYLDLFRKFIPPLGMFDISPVVAMFALMILERICLYAVAILMSLIGVGA